MGHRSISTRIRAVEVEHRARRFIATSLAYRYYTSLFFLQRALPRCAVTTGPFRLTPHPLTLLQTTLPYCSSTAPHSIGKHLPIHPITAPTEATHDRTHEHSNQCYTSATTRTGTTGISAATHSTDHCALAYFTLFYSPTTQRRYPYIAPTSVRSPIQSKILCCNFPADFHVLCAELASTVQFNLFKPPSEGLRGLEWDILLLVTSQKHCGWMQYWGVDWGFGNLAGMYSNLLYRICRTLAVFYSGGAESGSWVGW